MKKLERISLILLITGIIGLLPSLAGSASASPSLDSEITLTTSVVGNGTLTASPNLPSYTYGQEVTLDAVPSFGWRLDNWSGDLDAGMSWWNTYWPYRTFMTIDASGYDRQNKVADVPINFTTLLQQVGDASAFEPESIRVVEINAGGDILNANVSFQFDKDSAYNASTNAAGILAILLDGTTTANSSRLYHIYFAPAGQPYSIPSFTRLITSTFSSVTDEGEPSFQFDTPSGTYFYHTEGGGFSSLNDVDGNDWINYNNSVGSGGTYRGIPNLIYRGPVLSGGFHPGYSGSVTTRLSDGPLKATYRTVDGDWEAIWEIYPDSVRMTLVEAEDNYWFLYEGTPGGSLDQNDFSVRSDGTQYAHNAIWADDIPGAEWIYFSDPNVGDDGRSLFLVHHEEDSQFDSYRRMSDSNGSMTVFGFGRDGTTTHMSATPQRFTFGLIDEISHSDAKPLIEAAYKELTATLGTPEAVSLTTPFAPGTTSTFTMPLNMTRAVTVTFVPEHYTIETNTSGSGVITVSAPADPQGYGYGEVATLTAQAAAGWRFVGWTGLSVSSTLTTTSVTVTNDMTVTAIFEQHEYTLTLVQPNAGGLITATPNKALYTFGELIELTATASLGYNFDSWQGDFASTMAVDTVGITQDMTITALFNPASYVITTATTGNGQINLLPDQPQYTYDDEVAVEAVAELGWLFDRWSGALSGSNPSATITVQQSEQLTATFVQEQYSLTTQVNGSGSINVEPDQATYTYGDNVTMSAIAADHWDFVGWSGPITGSTPTETITISENEEVTATFTPHLYSLALQSLGGGSVTISSAALGYAFGETVVLTATPSSGWQLAEWTGDFNGEDAVATVVITGDMTIQALFEEAATTVDPQVVGEGTVALVPEQSEYDPGTEVTLTAQAQPGWRFVSWDDGDTSLTKVVSAAAGLKPIATFEQEQYTVTINIVGNGTVTTGDPTKLTYTYGEKALLSAQPDANWFFSGWQDGLTGSQLNEELIVTEDVVVTATFTTSPYNLTTSIIGNGRIVINPNRSSYNANETIMIEALPDAGWRFDRWGGELSGTERNVLLTISGNHTISATFVEIDDTGGTDSQFIYIPLMSASQ